MTKTINKRRVINLIPASYFNNVSVHNRMFGLKKYLIGNSERVNIVRKNT